MIKKLKVEDITKIMYLDDKIEDYFPCDKGEWVQWLIQHVDDPNLFILGAFEDDKLKGYMVAVNSVNPPVSRSVSIIYSKTANKRLNNKGLEEVISWAKEKGAITLDIVTNNQVGHTVYGFKKKAILMSRNL